MHVISAILVGLAAAAVSLGRILITNSEALTNMVWAEDGIFPLCVDKVGPLSCTIDPYAGYLIFLPRLIAVPISWLPLDSWAWATNGAAALVAGVLSAVVFASLRSWGSGVLAALAIALLPVAAPIVGLEAINVYSSVYMLLLFTMVIALTTWTNGRSVWWAAAGMTVTALTIPSAIVLVVPLILIMIRSRISVRNGLVLLAALAIGLIMQFGVALTAENPRPVSVSWGSLTGWVDNIPVALLTLWPGMNFGPSVIFGIFDTPVQAWTGWLVVIGGLVTGIMLLIRHDEELSAIGVLLLSGLAVGAIPTVIGYVNNRYFVVPVLLWAAAGVLALARVRWRNPAAMGLAGLALLAFLWWPAFPASGWRAGASPSWFDEVNRINSVCSSDPAANVDVVFSPDWPMPQVELHEPTTGKAKCIEVSDH